MRAHEAGAAGVAVPLMLRLDLRACEFCTVNSRETVQNVGGQAARRYGRLARHSAAVWSLSNVPFMTAVRTLSIRCAPQGDRRICCLAFIRRCSSHCTVLSVVAVEIGCSQRRAVA